MQHRKRTRGTSTRKRGRTAAEPEPEPEPVAPSSLTISLSPPPPLVEEQQPQQQASCKRARVTSAELTAAAAASPCPAVCYPGFRQIPCPSMGCTLRVMPVDQIPASSAFHTARNYDLVPPKPKRLGCTIFSLPNQPRTCSVEVDLVELPGMTWMYAVPKSMNWPAFMRRLRLDRMLELSELPTPERPGQSAREMFLYRLRGWAIAAPAVLAPGIPLVPISEWSHSYLSDEAAAAAATPTATATAAATQEASACFSTTAADAAIRDTLSRVVDLKSLEPEYQLLEATQNICLLFSGRLFRPARLVGPEHVLQRSIYQCAAHSNRCLDTVRALMMDNTTDSPTLTPRDSSTVPTAVRIVQVGIYRGTPAEDCDVRYFAVPADAVQDLPAVQARSLTASDADVSSTASTSPHASPIKPSSARSASSSSSSSSTTSSPSLLSDGSNETGTLPDSDVDTHRARLFGSTESWQHSLSDLVWSVRKLGGCEVDPTEHVYCGRLRPICAEHHGEASATSITPNEAWPTYLPSVVIDLTKHRLCVMVAAPQPPVPTILSVIQSYFPADIASRIYPSLRTALASVLSRQEVVATAAASQVPTTPPQTTTPSATQHFPAPPMRDRLRPMRRRGVATVSIFSPTSASHSRVPQRHQGLPDVFRGTRPQQRWTTPTGGTRALVSVGAATPNDIDMLL